MSIPTTTRTPNPTPAAGPTSWIVTTVVAASLALAGIVAVLFVGFGAPVHAQTASTPEQSVITQPSAGDHNTTPTGRMRPVRPSATIKLLQEQLGQLNYYNGPVTGYMNRATVQAIEYLQRDAHLPQTGQLNAATENALNSMLQNGNNQMNTNGNTMNN